jgi:hypothetical protein
MGRSKARHKDICLGQIKWANIQRYRILRIQGGAALDFAAGFVLVCLYTGKEDDPAYEQRFFEMYGT